MGRVSNPVSGTSLFLIPRPTDGELPLLRPMVTDCRFRLPLTSYGTQTGLEPVNVSKVIRDLLGLDVVGYE